MLVRVSERGLELFHLPLDSLHFIVIARAPSSWVSRTSGCDLDLICFLLSPCLSATRNGNVVFYKGSKVKGEQSLYVWRWWRLKEELKTGRHSLWLAEDRCVRQPGFIGSCFRIVCNINNCCRNVGTNILLVIYIWLLGAKAVVIMIMIIIITMILIMIMIMIIIINHHRKY